MRTCTWSRPSSARASWRACCWRVGPRRSCAIRTSLRMCSAPRACTGSSTSATACRSSARVGVRRRAGELVRVAAHSAVAPGHRGHAGPRPRGRAGGDDEFPAVIAGVPEELAKVELAGGKRIDGHAPGVGGHVPRRVPGDRHRKRSRGDDLRRSAGEAAARRVGAAARGLERPQPARSAAARARIRARAVRVLHR